MWTTLGALALGTAVGLRHALEPDHLTAVSTLVVDARDARRGMWLGAAWGLGHTISLVLVGTFLLVTETALSPRATSALELAVAVMLVVLGVRSLVAAVREGTRGTIHAHAHRFGVRNAIGGKAGAHTHAGPAAHLHLAGKTLAWRPLVVGLVHGLAGSGAITALVFAKLPTLPSRLAYITLFGLGSCLGMAAISGLAGAGLRHLAAYKRSISIFAGTLSIAVGIAWAIPELTTL